MANRAVSFTFTTEDQQALASLKRLEKGFRGLDVEVDRTRKSGLSLGQSLGGLALGAGAMFAVSEFEEAEQSARSTEAVIRSTGNAAEVSAKQQEELVDQLSRLAGVDDEVVNAGANMLRTFTDIKGENFGRTLGASLDYAAMKGVDLSAAAELMGKALNNPLTGMTKLSKAGVVFTDSQKEQIRNFMAMGDTASAQGVILDELEKEYGGQAEAMATSSGKMKVAIGNAAEAAGEVLAPAMTFGADAAGKLAAGFGALPVPVRTATVGLLAAAYAGPKVVDGLSAAKETIVQTASAAKDLAIRGKEMAKDLVVPSSAVDGLGGVDTQTTKLNSTLAQTAGRTAALGAGIVAVSAVTASWAEKQQKAAAESARLEAAINSLRDTAVQTGNSVEETFRDTLAERISSNSMATKQWSIDAGELAEAIEAGGPAFEAYQQRMIDAEAASGGGARSAVELGAFIKQLKNEYDGAVGSVGAYRDIQKDLEEETPVYLSAVGDQSRAVGNLTDEYMEQVDAIKQLNDETERAISLANELAGGELAVAAAHDAVQDAQMDLGRARNEGDAEDRQRAADDLTASIIAESEAVVKLAEDQAKLEGRTLSAADKAEIQREKLRQLQGQTGFTSTTLDGLIRRLDEAAWERTVKVNTQKAEQDLDRLINKLNDTIEGFGKLISIAGVDIIGSSVSGAIETATRGAGGGGNLRRGPVPAGSLRGEGTMIVHNMNVTPTSREVEAHRRKMDRQNGRKIKVGRR